MRNRHFFAALLILGALMPHDSSAAKPKATPAADRIAQLLAADQRPDAATTQQLARDGALLLDVRSEEEWKEGHVKGARHMPWQSLDAATAGLPANKDAPIVTYCASGGRSQLAVLKLRALGYTRAVSMTGGFKDLKDAGMAVE